jgi:hypothetical protein
MILIVRIPLTEFNYQQEYDIFNKKFPIGGQADRDPMISIVQLPVTAFDYQQKEDIFQKNFQ